MPPRRSRRQEEEDDDDDEEELQALPSDDDEEEEEYVYHSHCDYTPTHSPVAFSVHTVLRLCGDSRKHVMTIMCLAVGIVASAGLPASRQSPSALLWLG